ncbi:MAG: hypothetical protein ACLGHY_14820, partial [Gammaproteobacteria bacterium]
MLVEVDAALFGLGATLALAPATPPRLEELLFGDLLGISGADLLAAAEGDLTGLHRVYHGFDRVRRSPLVTIAAVNGAAVGAGRGRLVRQLLAESLVLALLGALLGAGLAHFLVRGLVAIAPQDVPRLDQARVDGAVLAFTLGVAVLCSLL